MAKAKASSLAGGFKTRITALEREVKKKKKELARLAGCEKRARKRWTRGYRAHLAAAEQLADLNVHKTKREARLKKKIKTWPAKSDSLTEERDAFREQIQGVVQALAGLGAQLATLKEQELNQTRTTDEVVTQVFALNDVVVRAAADREEYLKRQVFPRLVDEQGNLRSQVTFDSADGLRRVVALVNEMTIVKSDLAAEAQQLVESFFEHFQRPPKLDPKIEALYELTHQLLTTKTSFKVGPDLYRFLSMEIDADICPELARAQTLLRQSIRSEKTSSYIRLYERKSRTDKWTPVHQS